MIPNTEDIGPSRKIAEFVSHTSLKDIPAAAIEGAKLTILDTIGVGLAALDQPVAKAIQEYVRSMGGEPAATVMGMGGYRTSPALAALANGCFFNMLDFDGFGHVPTCVLPAALAVGETIRASGERVLEASILAAEAQTQLDHAIAGRSSSFGGLTYRGWYHVSVCGPIGAALAAGKLLGLDARQTQEAMGTAACASGGVRKNMGTRAKSLFSGNSASFGVTAALLAKAGVSGDPDVLEGQGGLVNTLCSPGEFDWAPIMEHLGKSYELAGSLGMKRYPAVSGVGQIIAALEQLRRTSGFDGSEVVRVEARLTPKPAKSTPIPGLVDDWSISPTVSGLSDYPPDELAAEFSMSYGIAVTLLDGTFNVDHLTEGRVQDPRTRELASKIEFIPLKTWSDHPESVTVYLRDGRSFTAETRQPRRTLQREDFVTKFKDCAGRHLAGAQVEQLCEHILEMEKLDTIGEVAATLARR